MANFLKHAHLACLYVILDNSYLILGPVQMPNFSWAEPNRLK